MRFDYMRFGDLFAIPQRNGLTKPKRVRGSGVPMVNMGELFGYPRIRNIPMDLVPITEREKECFLLSGDLLFARQSLVLEGAGQCSIFLGNNFPTVFESHLIRCRLNHEIAHPEFYFYFFQSHEGKALIKSIVEQGAGASGIRGSDLIELQVPCPPIQFQKKVSSILSVLDDRIDLLGEINITLSSLLEAIFKSWFVQFDFIHQKNSNDIVEKNLNELFPAEMVESEVGSVPKGWKILSLDEIANFLNGLALQRFPPTGNNDLPVIKISQLRKKNTTGADFSSCNIRPQYIIQDGDVLFSWSGTLEVDIWCGGLGALNQHLFKVTSTEYPKWFYYLWLKQHLKTFREIAASKATTMGHIQRIHLTEAKVIVPDLECLSAADKIFSPLLDKIVANSLLARNLEQLKITWLSRLVSGQMDLSEIALN